MSIHNSDSLHGHSPIRRVAMALSLSAALFYHPAITSAEVTYVGGISGAHVGTLNVPVPPSVQDDDLLVAVASIKSANPITPSAGWVPIHARTAGGGLSTYAWYKVADSESGFYSFQQAGFDHLVAVIGVYRGVDPSNPIAGQNVNSAFGPTAPNPPSLTTTLADAMLITHGTVDRTTSFSPPSGFAERLDWNGFLGLSIGLADRLQPIPGLVNPSPFSTPDQGSCMAGTIALRPVYLDLSLTKTVDDPTPQTDDTITFTITVTNQSVISATGVEVTDVLPVGILYDSFGSSQGTYDGSNGVWSVGHLPGGAGATLYITSVVVGVQVSHTLTNPTPQINDAFGYSVSGIGSNYFVVGAYGNDDLYLDNGGAYLYDKNGTLVRTIPNPTPAQYNYFGFAVSGFGDHRFLVSEWETAVHLIDVDGTVLATMTNNAFYGPVPHYGEFGRALSSVAEDLIVVGCPYDNERFPDDDLTAVLLYDTNGTLMVTITNPSPAYEERFGFAVAGLGHDRIVVGAPNKHVPGKADAGVVYLFDTAGVLMVTVTNPAPKTNDRFGYAVAAVTSNLFVVGSSGADKAYLYDKNGTLLQTIDTPYELGGVFGESVAGVGQDLFAVGSAYGGEPYGAVYLYNTNGVLLSVLDNPSTASIDEFSISIAALGKDQIVIGDSSNHEDASYSGRAYLFDLNAGIAMITNTASLTRLNETDLNASNNTASAIVGTDMDQDNLADAWEMKHFGKLSRTGAGDADGDGLTDAVESGFGTDPNNQNSDGDPADDYAEFIADTDGMDPAHFFQVVIPPATVPGIFKMDWRSAMGRRYTVQRNTDLLAPNWLDQQLISGDGSMKSYTNPVSGPARQFLRLKVELE